MKLGGHHATPKGKLRESPRWAVLEIRIVFAQLEMVATGRIETDLQVASAKTGSTLY